jgi:hypothetical protein
MMKRKDRIIFRRRDSDKERTKVRERERERDRRIVLKEWVIDQKMNKE